MSKIAIIDSGVGGLSIYQAIKKELPEQDYLFVSDNQAFPYGTKPAEQLKTRVFEIVERVIQQFNPDLLVIACNTASTVVLPLLREHFSLPIVGVVPAIKPAAKQSKTKKIGLLATPATINRSYTDELIQEFASDCEVIRVGSSRLVEIAEDKLAGRAVNTEQITEILEPFIEAEELDSIVLACTHFPLLNKEIESILEVNSHSIKLVDSGQGIANRVVQLCDSLSKSESDAGHNSSLAVFTDLDALGEPFIEQIHKLGFKETLELS